MNEADLLHHLRTMFGDDEWPIAVRLVRGLHLVRTGLPAPAAAKAVGTTVRRLQQILESPDPVAASLGGQEIAAEPARTKATRALGQMLVGRAAEQVFLDLFRDAFRDEELNIENVAGAGTDTDIYLVNGRGRKLYRINIKFFGAVFRRAQEIVGLDPEDCFALATYKIRSGLEKETAESKPYVFAVVRLPGLTADAAAARFPSAVLSVAALVLGSKAPNKRQFEDRVIDYAVAQGLSAYTDTYAQIRSAPWYILSAVRAYNLTRELLFQRIPALTVRNFTRHFRGAEVDMHFSLAKDLTPLGTFFAQLKEAGRERVTTLMSRGEI